MGSLCSPISMAFFTGDGPQLCWPSLSSTTPRTLPSPAPLRGVVGRFVVGDPAAHVAGVVVLLDPVLQQAVGADVAGDLEGQREAQLLDGGPLRVGDVRAVGAVHRDEHAAWQLLGVGA